MVFRPPSLCAIAPSVTWNSAARVNELSAAAPLFLPGTSWLNAYFDIDDANGKPTIDGHVPIHRRFLAQLLEATTVAKALGLPGPFSIPPLPAELVAPLVHVDQNSANTTWEWAAIIDRPKPIISSLNAFDEVDVGASSEIGGVLKAAGFKATAAIRYEDANLVYAVPGGWQ